MNNKHFKTGKKLAISGMSCTTAALVLFFLNGAPFYYAILFLLGLILGFSGAFYIFLSMRKPKE